MLGGSRSRRIASSPSLAEHAASAEPSSSSNHRRPSPSPPRLCTPLTAAGDRPRRRAGHMRRALRIVVPVGLALVGVGTVDRYLGRALMDTASLTSLYGSYYGDSNAPVSAGGATPKRRADRQRRQQMRKRRGQRQQPPGDGADETDLPPLSPLEDDGGPEKCALGFWGLPRAFEALVLPTLRANVLTPNAAYGCDVFVHYHHLEAEAPSRSGRGGRLDPREIFLLEAAVREAATAVATNGSSNAPYEPVVRFTRSTEADFFRRRGAFLNRTHTARDSRGRYKYFPWKEKSFVFPTTADNIVRMWDGLAAVSKLLKDYESEAGVRYTRIAMLRSDVAFVTPIDIYTVNGDRNATLVRNTAVVPGFAKWPVNDRMIYGPAAAVKLWAGERFRRIERHVQAIARTHPGRGIQDEYYLSLTIFPAIRAMGVDVVEDPDLCFLRARVDESIWLNDCGEDLLDERQRAVEALVNRTCRRSRLDENVKKGVVQLECQQGVMVDQ